MGREFRGKGANVMLGPSVNVHRVASNGRNFEYLSGEDPYLGARLVRPFVRGVQSEGVMACAKHFAFNEQETNRGTDKGPASSSEVEARTAWEIYYPPFEAAVEAGVGSFMCSYNRVNGTHACENPDILARDLKGTMGFKGFVMSDWGATHSTGAVATGLDQDMPGGNDKLFSITELKQGWGQATDEAVVRILSAIYRLRLDERTACTPPACFADMLKAVRNNAAVQLAREAATRSVTLLKNDGILPLQPARVKSLAVLGMAAVMPPARELLGVAPDYYAGGGSGHVSARQVVTAFDGMQQRAQELGISIMHSTVEDPSNVRAAVAHADAVVVVGATTASEGSDRRSLDLDRNVNALIAAVAQLKPTVVLMQTPGAVLTPWRDSVAAAANLFLGGEESGHAWAAVLFGDESPSGKLPIMMPASEADVHHPEGTVTRYEETLFTSYRSTGLRYAYAFGHGLSYTNFSYGEPSLAQGCQEQLCVQVTVSNAGSRPGAEVAQAYLAFPPEAGEPRLVLRGFHRTKTLAPGESELATFAFRSRDLSTWSPVAGWVVQKGITAHIGASSVDIRRTMPLP